MSRNQHKTKLAFTVQEACATSSIGRSSLYAEIKAGRLRSCKVGRRTIILHEDLLAWLNALPRDQEIVR